MSVSRLQVKTFTFVPASISGLNHFSAFESYMRRSLSLAAPVSYIILSHLKQKCHLHRGMYETTSSSSPRTIPPLVPPPSLFLTSYQKNNDFSGPSGSSEHNRIKSFSRAFHHIVFPRRFRKIDCPQGDGRG